MRRVISFGYAIVFLIASGVSARAAENAPAMPAPAPVAPAAQVAHPVSGAQPGPSVSVPAPQAIASAAVEKQAKLPPMTIVITPTRMPQPLGEAGVTTSVVTQRQMQTQPVQTTLNAF